MQFKSLSDPVRFSGIKISKMIRECNADDYSAHKDFVKHFDLDSIHHTSHLVKVMTGVILGKRIGSKTRNCQLLLTGTTSEARIQSMLLS